MNWSRKTKKKAYLDIETDYIGPHDDQRLFRDQKNQRGMAPTS